jgi:hypothetical protein
VRLAIVHEDRRFIDNRRGGERLLRVEHGVDACAGHHSAEAANHHVVVVHVVGLLVLLRGAAQCGYETHDISKCEIYYLVSLFRLWIVVTFNDFYFTQS